MGPHKDGSTQRPLQKRAQGELGCRLHFSALTQRLIAAWSSVWTNFHLLITGDQPGEGECDIPRLPQVFQLPKPERFPKLLSRTDVPSWTVFLASHSTLRWHMPRSVVCTGSIFKKSIMVGGHSALSFTAWTGSTDALHLVYFAGMRQPTAVGLYNKGSRNAHVLCL